MRLTGLYIGQSAMMANGTALAFSADNVANANTPGFKQQRAEFSNVIADTSKGFYTTTISSGAGVATVGSTSVHNQGGIDKTGRDLDVAIMGDGYFSVQAGNEVYYTRTGDFSINPEGFLANSSGDLVLGFTEASPDTAVPISLSNVSVLPTQTSSAQFGGNLNNEAELATVPTNPDRFQTLNSTSQFSSFTDVYDSLGNRHTLSMFFFHTSESGWTAQVYTDGEDVGQTPDTPVLLGSVDISFDELGNISQGVNTGMTVAPAWSTGAAPGNIQLDFGQLRGFASPSYLSFLAMDGSQGGSAANIEIQENGDVVAALSSGETTSVGTIALAKFRNSGALERVGDNSFRESPASGVPDIARPAVEGRGSLIGSSLETSNVDLTKEFIDVIRFQRGYQAGSRIIQTIDSLIEKTIAIG